MSALSGFQYTPRVLPDRALRWRPRHAAACAPYNSRVSNGVLRACPGCSRDSLPDRFGNTLINAWFSAQGARPAVLRRVERLCYTGTRGIGALEFRTAIRGGQPWREQSRSARSLIWLNGYWMTRCALRAKLSGDKRPRKPSKDILYVSHAAAVARAKAVLAWERGNRRVPLWSKRAGKKGLQWNHEI